MTRVFSQKHSSTSVGNRGIYSVGKVSVYQIWQFSKAECFVGISQEGLTRETLMKTSCLHPILTFRILVMCRAHASLRGKPTRELPVKTALVFNCLEFSHTHTHTLSLSLSLSHTHTTLTNKSYIIYRYIRLNKITIKFGTELKLNVQKVCKTPINV